MFDSPPPRETYKPNADPSITEDTCIISADGTTWTRDQIYSLAQFAANALEEKYKVQMEDVIVVWAGYDTAVAVAMHLAVLKSRAAAVFIENIAEFCDACTTTGAKLALITRATWGSIQPLCPTETTTVLWEELISSTQMKNCTSAKMHNSGRNEDNELHGYNACWLRRIASSGKNCDHEQSTADYGICEHRHAAHHIIDRTVSSSSKSPSKHQGPWLLYTGPPQKKEITDNTYSSAAADSKKFSNCETIAVAILTTGALSELAFADAISVLSSGGHESGKTVRYTLLLAGGLVHSTQASEILKINGVNACTIDEELLWGLPEDMRESLPDLSAVCVYYRGDELSEATILCIQKWSEHVGFQALGGSLCEGIEFLSFESSDRSSAHRDCHDNNHEAVGDQMSGQRGMSDGQKAEEEQVFSAV
jgi:hypothetical protein